MSMLHNRHVLITGGTGSFGKKFAEILLREYSPKRLVIFSRDEQKHVDMARNHFPPDKYPQVRYFVGDVRDERRLKSSLRGIDFVIHAAAMKHVDVAEYNPQECIRTNIGGAENVIHAAIDAGVEKVVALSTDKAASPINLYGATKLCSDKLFVAANALAGGTGTQLAVVRYGNVFGSNGSVVPFFQKQRAKGVLPVTDPEMTRFIITLEHGVRFVLAGIENMSGGEIFVPKLPSTTVMDIAKAVAPECSTKIVGIRPGEKLHECMIPADEARQTFEYDKHYVILPVAKANEMAESLPLGVKRCAENFCYASDTNTDWLTVEQIRHMIEHHSQQPAAKNLRIAG
ncbi:MAG: UDP-N-acetylglucosamine 4,6-dehydratase (inverting) [Pirellulales bacterium]|nr:UDP-N-acetylglucosamine 4,6-dehydratase (inverting) [Pirellulales bacterium]